MRPHKHGLVCVGPQIEGMSFANVAHGVQAQCQMECMQPKA